jgi:hypothetical protein
MGAHVPMLLAVTVFLVFSCSLQRLHLFHLSLMGRLLDRQHAVSQLDNFKRRWCLLRAEKMVQPGAGLLAQWRNETKRIFIRSIGLRILYDHQDRCVVDLRWGGCRVCHIRRQFRVSQC